MTKSSTARAFAASVAAALVLASCSARPSDAPTVEDRMPAEQNSQSARTNNEAREKAEHKAQEEARRVIRVGVDSFTGNLNPHMKGNLDPVVSAISDLTLPSVFTAGPKGLVMDKDLVESVKPDDEEAPTRVTYTLTSAAQWSDGTPITVSDFQYLAEELAEEPAAAESGLYQHIKTIETSVSSTHFTVVFDQPFTSWKRLFHHLLPSHIYRGENRPFAEMMREASAASGGAYALKHIDAGRGFVELQRNDRYWGEEPAATDRILFTSVPDINTGAQMLRTKQINMLVQQSESTTQLTLNQLKDVQQRSLVRPVQLNLVLNSQKPGLTTSSARAHILSSIRAREIGQIVAQDMDAERPEWQVSPSASHAPKRAHFTADEPLVIAAPQEDQKAVVAARTAADQLSQAGIPARAVQQDSVELFSRTSTKDAPDAIVLWQYSPSDLGDYVSQFQCKSGKGKNAEEPHAAASSEKLDDHSESQGEHAHPSHGQDSTSRATSLPPVQEGDVPLGGGNVSALCDNDINALLAKLEAGDEDLRGSREELNTLIAEQAVVQPLLGSRSSVARAKVLQGPTNELAEWPITSSAGIFATAHQWTIDPLADTKENHDRHG
ncbi:ABC transporter family substrate-binding protein [Corynebacterium sp. zg254]|uniref:ABC transporter family substrate-binding protein n=1 Tax=Corynebacterium zhongnanshanii TaxID=2768834 RepID=A0ABQ6VFU3_9CORY|nr:MULTISPECIES: ABC transporter substrate-binding protein [Corynebacterium]KAB3523168.1 ABC transporter family substrate-binding protein [Corynebacterium zhongnanshanii]MCR5913725.1 ABC transporter family substrate-binding protein [Corynebacterium sp. zg254]